VSIELAGKYSAAGASLCTDCAGGKFLGSEAKTSATDCGNCVAASGAQHHLQRHRVLQHIPIIDPTDKAPPGESFGGPRVHKLAVSGLSDFSMSIT